MINKIISIQVLIGLFCIQLSFSQVSISNKPDQQPHESAILDLISEDKGFILPSINGNNNIDDPAESLLIYNTITSCFETFLEGEWHEIWCAEIEHPEPIDCEGTFTDDRDGTEYKMVAIGDQCWFAENLRYDNGCGEVVWEDNSDQGWCGIYDDGDFADNDTIFGLLYQWSAAMNGSTTEGAQGLCPPGWKIPSHDDWTTLEQYICDEAGNANCNSEFPFDNSTEYWRGTDEGSRLAGSDLWEEDDLTNNPAFDENSDFNALPGGLRYNMNITPTTFAFDYVYEQLRWWTSTECSSDTEQAWRRRLEYDKTGVKRNKRNKALGFSVRCIKDLD